MLVLRRRIANIRKSVSWERILLSIWCYSKVERYDENFPGKKITLSKHLPIFQLAFSLQKENFSNTTYVDREVGKKNYITRKNINTLKYETICFHFFFRGKRNSRKPLFFIFKESKNSQGVWTFFHNDIYFFNSWFKKQCVILYIFFR